MNDEEQRIELESAIEMVPVICKRLVGRGPDCLKSLLERILSSDVCKDHGEKADVCGIFTLATMMMLLQDQIDSMECHTVAVDPGAMQQLLQHLKEDEDTKRN